MKGPALLLLLFYALSVAVVLLWVLVEMQRRRRWCDRENTRLQTEYRDAKERGELVVPPNVWRYGP